MVSRVENIHEFDQNDKRNSWNLERDEWLASLLKEM
jgi:hypothetical protein